MAGPKGKVNGGRSIRRDGPRAGARQARRFAARIVHERASHKLETTGAMTLGVSNVRRTGRDRIARKEPAWKLRLVRLQAGRMQVIVSAVSPGVPAGARQGRGGLFRGSSTVPRS